MLAVIFELKPLHGKGSEYFELATTLKSRLEEIDGFISIERFQSLAEPDKYLSLSFWRDEEAVQQWRNLEEHRQAQQKGRESILAHYRLRVACVVRDYDIHDNAQRPLDSVERFTKGP